MELTQTRASAVAEAPSVSPELAEEVAWRPRHIKRRRGIMAVKHTDVYCRILLLESTNDMDSSVRPLTPDPEDRAMSKRAWEKSMQAWRQAVKEHGRWSM